MSLRELKGLTWEGEPEVVPSRLRNGGVTMEKSAMSDSSAREDSAEEGEVEELTMQLHHTRRVAEATKEESEERGQKVLRLSEEVDQQSKTITELEDMLDRQRTELEAVKMRMELERLRQLEEVCRQLEEVRCQSDKERERFRTENERNAILVDKLRMELTEKDQQVGVLETSAGGGESPLMSERADLRAGDTRTGSASAGEGAIECRRTASPRVTFAETARVCRDSDENGSDSETTVSDSPASLAAPTTTNPFDTDDHDSSSQATCAGEFLNDSTACTETGSDLMQQLTQLVQTQTDMVIAQTRAMSAQSLPPIPHFSGEDCHSYEDSFDKWLEQFEERSKIVGWSEEHQRYHLKMSLDKTAFQTYRLLPDDVKSSYAATVSALKSRFKPVDIEELRGMEFHELKQTKQSVEQLGLELQKLAKRAFPLITGKDFDRLLKGRFFQALFPRWQRKLGAPKPDESFDELFARARTTERREEQYSTTTSDRGKSSGWYETN